MEAIDTSFILEKPAAAATSGRSSSKSVLGNVKLHDALQTQYIDLDDTDVSTLASLTRQITKAVGNVFTPRQILGLLRVLKAATLAFLALGLLATTMYIIVVQLVAVPQVRRVAGGTRDIVLRIYALGLSCLGVAIELDYTRCIKRLAVLKGFVWRAFLYFLISQLTAPPLVQKILSSEGYSGGSENDNNDGDDDQISSVNVEETIIPSSSIGFQRVTSFVLACCALGYLICGLLCFDRFRAKAFLTSRDPRVTTAIPSTNERARPSQVVDAVDEADSPK